MNGAPPVSPRDRLGAAWIRQQSGGDRERIKVVIRNAMNCGQTSVSVLRLKLDESGDLILEENIRVDDPLCCPLWKARDVISKERFKIQETGAGYRLHHKYTSLIQLIEQEGLAWCIGNSIKGTNDITQEPYVDPMHSLIVYWHPSTSSENQPNALHKYYLSLVMQQPIDEQRLKRYYGIIKGAMDSGQNSCIISCLGYQQSYWKVDSSNVHNSRWICKETRHYLTGAHVVLPNISPEWMVDAKFEPLLTWLTDRQGLSWTLRFAPLDENKFILDVERQLHPWALLVVRW